MSKLSRRDFFRGAGTVGLAVAAGGLFTVTIQMPTAARVKPLPPGMYNYAIQAIHSDLIMARVRSDVLLQHVKDIDRTIWFGVPKGYPCA